MKIIISRKGFDSGSGGYPSIIFPDNTMQSLPIPSCSDDISYADVMSRYKNKSLLELMRHNMDRVKEANWKTLDESVKCHLDPDIDYSALKRGDGWRGCFGQIDAAQTVLENSNVGCGDIFIFFGWFRDYKDGNSTIRNKTDSGKHAFFGYLQIERLLYPAREPIPEWLEYHPHAGGDRKWGANNCIYIAREKASWNETIPGYGVFRYHQELDLTKPGMSRSKWDLPDCFRGLHITYHTQNSWKDGYFQSAARGQEFVVEESDAVTAWAKSLIENHVVM